MLNLSTGVGASHAAQGNLFGGILFDEMHVLRSGRIIRGAGSFMQRWKVANGKAMAETIRLRCAGGNGTTSVPSIRNDSIPDV